MSERAETGRCICGNVHFRFDRRAVLSCSHCHCRDCQRATGSAFATFCVVPESAVEIESGQPKSFSVTSDSGGRVTRSFCGNCGSQLYSTVTAMPGFVFVKAGSLDDATWLEPRADIWVSSAQPWCPPLTSITHEGNPG